MADQTTITDDLRPLLHELFEWRGDSWTFVYRFVSDVEVPADDPDDDPTIEEHPWDFTGWTPTGTARNIDDTEVGALLVEILDEDSDDLPDDFDPEDPLGWVRVKMPPDVSQAIEIVPGLTAGADAQVELYDGDDTLIDRITLVAYRLNYDPDYTRPEGG